VEYASETGLHSELATTLGAGGLFIASDEPLAETTRLKLRFQLPGVQPRWEIEGRVAWADATGMGIEFVDREAVGRLAAALESLAPPSER
jgi:Tfp pilus assembly protein PilZ